jgi:heme-degrading monooxygenase HmoA
MSVKAQHVVLFKFAEELTPEEEEEMFTLVAAWPASIPGFTGLRLGRDVSGRSGGFQYLLLTEFESEEAHQAYYEQPAHVAFSNWVFERGCEVIRMDYPLDKRTLMLDPRT